MRRVHIIGHKNHGKTELVVALVEELTKRGLCVGTMKHTHHRHELDTPGKDSHRHRQAGAAVVGVLSGRVSAVFLPANPDAIAKDRYAEIAAMFRGCDLVLVEGDTSTSDAKIEVWRAERGSRPLAEADTSILAVVTDDAVAVGCLVLRRSRVDEVADWIIQNHAHPPAGH